MVVRARIDGVTRPVATIPKAMQLGVSSRLKIMGNLDIAERRAPQDGRVSIKFGGNPLDLRIAIMPAPISPATSSPTRTDARETRCTTVFTFRSLLTI